MSYPTSALLPLWRRLSFLLIALLGFTASSCDDDDDTLPTDTQQNIVQVAQGNPDFSILVAAVTKADLGATLSGTGPFTVLAPTNAAFAQLGAPFNTAASINAIPAGDPQIATLRNILLYHVLAGRIAAADFPAGASAQLTQKPASASGVNDNTVYASKTGTTIRLNGTTSVVTADVAASNGIIHAIDRVLMPPTGKISDIVVASASASPAQFTLLLQALQRPAAAALLTAAANPASNLTVFAPTDAAFQALLTQLGATSLSQVPDATLVAVLQLHIVGSRAFSTDLSSGAVTTLGGPVTVAVNSNTVTVRGNGNGTNNATVTTANILASNGVIHVIDRVLLP